MRRFWEPRPRFRQQMRASCQLTSSGPFASMADCTNACKTFYACDPQLQRCVESPSGKYTSAEACTTAEKCGYKWGCNGTTGVCELSASGTYETQDECRTASQCGYTYGCDESGACILMDGGKYATADACRCFDCNSGEGKCTAVGYNRQGTFQTLEQCQADSGAQCGWKWGCDASDPDAVGSGLYCKKMQNGIWDYASDCNCVSCVGGPGPGGSCTYDAAAPEQARFHDVATCKASADDKYGKCGWKYKCV